MASITSITASPALIVTGTTSTLTPVISNVDSVETINVVEGVRSGSVTVPLHEALSFSVNPADTGKPGVVVATADQGGLLAVNGSGFTFTAADGPACTPTVTVTVDGSSATTQLTVQLPTGAPFYAPTSFWNRPLNPTTDIMGGAGTGKSPANQINYGRQPTDMSAGINMPYTFQSYTLPGVGYGPYNRQYATTFNCQQFSIPVYSVDATRDSPLQVGVINHTTPPTAKNPFGIQGYCNAIPFPDVTKCPRINPNQPAGSLLMGLASDPATGGDKSIVIVDFKNDRCWEFWVAEQWAAAQNLYTPPAAWTAGNAGYFGPELGAGKTLSTSNGVVPNGTSWGMRATGLGALGGLITLQDLRNVFHGGTINHAIAIAVPMTSGGGLPPAVRGDGSGAGNTVATIPAGFPNAGQPNPAYGLFDRVGEGHRYRFPPGTTSALPSGMYPFARELVRAIETYGLYLVDTSGCVSFYIEDPRTIGSPYHLQGPTAVDPFTLPWSAVNPDGGNDPRWDKNGWPIWWQMPWDQLQILNTITS